MEGQGAVVEVEFPRRSATRVAGQQGLLGKARRQQESLDLAEAARLDRHHQQEKVQAGQLAGPAAADQETVVARTDQAAFAAVEIADGATIAAAGRNESPPGLPQQVMPALRQARGRDPAPHVASPGFGPAASPRRF